ncbi:MAG: hypothetical protein OMM_06752 [Candidatus Magnetoglobus multicellularis str. Araruama]|uniref:DUF433 domain-containing protein n=1 Tax=Candidatus Magnetoglobus multicellularis str. Araruama TaxID=890399 RepID=A0A1V1PFS2_9BACT|nr:MAG: hypothetical protein OMM_06752 [Candidatus Magnetoglobus multicellularis str. Araruama]
MKSENKFLSRITVDSNVMVGKPTIRGLRITVEHILKSLASGLSFQELLDDYPILEKEDIQAVLFYAFEKISNEKIFSIKVRYGTPKYAQVSC